MTATEFPTAVDLLGAARPTDDELTALVSAALGRPVRLGSWMVERVAYVPGSPATGSLLRLKGSTVDGAEWSLFLKVLQHPRHWVGVDQLPPSVRAHFVANFPWRSELSAWDDEFMTALPDGLRVPVLYRLVELPDDRLAVWMEDVDVSDEPWSLPRYERAAWLLGRLAANRSSTELINSSPVPVGYGMRRFVDGPVRGGMICLRNDDIWRHPALSSPVAQQLRADLLGLAARVPVILDMLDSCPQALPHGDASPQNLLVPRNDPGTLVAIDIAFQCPLAMGSDLGQLLVGLAHAGQWPAAELLELHTVLEPSFVSGLTQGRQPVDPEQVRRGYIGSLVIRSAFTAIPFGELDHLPPAAIDHRLDMTRFIVDLAEQLPV